MKLSTRFVSALLLITGLILAWTAIPYGVDALQVRSAPTLDPTPLPSTIQPPLAPTATIDPGSIGDTSGVIALVIIIVAVILVGVLWGNHEFRMEAQKTRNPKE